MSPLLAGAGPALLRRSVSAIRRLSVNFDDALDYSPVYAAKHGLKGPLFGADAEAIPLWVADIDLPVCAKVQQAIIERAHHPSFGYAYLPEEVWSAAAQWQKERHGWVVDPQSFVFSPNIILAACCCVRAFTNPGDAIMVMTPLYPPLQDLVAAEGRRLVRHKLVEAAASPRSIEYSIDFEVFEEQIRRDRVRLLLFCSPQNPSGRVWRQDELQKLVEVCRAHNVMIVSDEAHADWSLFGSKHTPLATVAAPNEVVTLGGPGKTFGIPGLHASFVAIEDESLRQSYLTTIAHTHLNEGSVFAVSGMLAAYQHGGPWLDSAKAYVEANMEEAERFLEERLPQVRPWRAQATFLMWLDFSRLEMTAADVQAMLIQAGVVLSPGEQFAQETRHFQRLNAACPRATLHEALRRIERAIQARGLA